MRIGGDDPDELITTAEAAPILGYTVAWVNKLASSGRLPVARKLPGRTGAYLFRRGELAIAPNEREPASAAS